MTFPQQLKHHRKRLGLTQAELADILEVSPRAVWQWENGKLPHALTREAVIARLEGRDANGVASAGGFDSARSAAYQAGYYTAKCGSFFRPAPFQANSEEASAWDRGYQDFKKSNKKIADS